MGGGGWGSFMSLDGCPWPRSQLCLMSGSVQLGDTSSATDFAFITLPSSSRLFSHLHPPQKWAERKQREPTGSSSLLGRPRLSSAGGQLEQQKRVFPQSRGLKPEVWVRRGWAPLLPFPGCSPWRVGGHLLPGLLRAFPPCIP